ncbi:antitoxin Xre/MbcA/ParS toxin-binding domain-containing protein [Pseudomonas sp. NFACC05-1]|uniref:type II RES/Xre toxin-antitoxin system antitoxin n=1 Tax=Pseudomonas sp. NFACC05-1 TaxID=1566241 RepID=UPI0008715A55|nr:antitoxin Xre/MbcA/ParS toxin-binding domain-containing protein [Pseudomonas sp. NFACC05-1]SCW97513.1 putative toxin-antitoxin system antitoxin component, TIGR02293 family [Pseudomonas sp. NFACC05-1]
MSAKKKDVAVVEAAKDGIRKRNVKPRASGAFVAVVSSGERTVKVMMQDSSHAPSMVAVLLSGKDGDDRMEIYRAVRKGFSLQSVLDMVENSEVYKRRGVLSKIVGTSERTLARRLKTPNEVLTPEQSTRALNYAEVLEKATVVLGSRELAEQWMAKPARGLDGETPIDLISNSVGYELVTDFLTRIEYGVY